MSNYSIFEENCLHAFAGEYEGQILEDVRSLFLKHGGDLKAEREAYRFGDLMETNAALTALGMKGLIDLGQLVEGCDPKSTLSSLNAFMRDTAYRHLHGNPQKTPWPHWSTY